MKQYIGTKIVRAELANRADRKVYSKASMIPAGAMVELGYRVIYEDGHESWSPRDVFEEAYRPTVGMTFGLAIEAMKKGLKVRRRGWNGKGIHIELQRPDAYSKMTSPYIFIDTTGLQTRNPDAPKSRVPWLASQTDMLSEDWEIVEQEEENDA